jgi:hypothetical protein
MEERKIELGDAFFVFTNWGLCKGRVVKIKNYLISTEKGYVYDITDGDEIPTDEDSTERKDLEICQYKLSIDIDEDNKNIRYGFWYTANQLFDNPEDAIYWICEQSGTCHLLR